MIILEGLKSILQAKTRCHILYCKNNSLIKESFITIINFKKENFFRIKLSLKYFWYFLLSFPLIHKFQLRLQQKKKTKPPKQTKNKLKTEFK